MQGRKTCARSQEKKRWTELDGGGGWGRGEDSATSMMPQTDKLKDEVISKH